MKLNQQQRDMLAEIATCQRYIGLGPEADSLAWAFDGGYVTAACQGPPLYLLELTPAGKAALADKGGE